MMYIINDTIPIRAYPEKYKKILQIFRDEGNELNIYGIPIMKYRPLVPEGVMLP